MTAATSFLKALSEADSATLVAMVSIVAMCVVFLCVRQVCKFSGNRRGK